MKKFLKNPRKVIAQFFINLWTQLVKRKVMNSKSSQLPELIIKIEEVPNKDILIYHVNDKLTGKNRWSFETEEDLNFGGMHSINFENNPVPEDIKYIAGALLAIDGLLQINFDRYEIRFTKAPVFDWPEIEKCIMDIIKRMLAKQRTVIIKERVRMSIGKDGRAVHTTL